jgi:triosephosphate isomerase
MNGSLVANAALVQALLLDDPQAWGCEVAVCVPAPYLAQVQTLTQGSAMALGAQDVSAQDSGAFTGEVSAAMLKDFGVRYCLVGHAERRQYHQESDAVVAI